MKTLKAFQDYYPNEVSHCYGCGRLNPSGLQIKSYWDGEETIATFTPRPEHTAIPGYVYGGLLASLVDCHATGSAAAASYKAENRPMDSAPPLRFVTASLKVDFLRPTPMGVELDIRGLVKEIKGKKVITEIKILANNQVCVQGEVVTVRVPASMLQGKS